MYCVMVIWLSPNFDMCGAGLAASSGYELVELWFPYLTMALFMLKYSHTLFKFGLESWYAGLCNQFGSRMLRL